MLRAALRAGTRTGRLEVGALVVLWLVALAIRLPRLWSAPRQPGEARDLFDLLAGVPLAAWLVPELAASPYGAAYDVTVGAAVALLGPNPHLPRLLAAVLGAATVPLVYVLARELTRPLGRRRLEDQFLGPRLAGLVAATLLATSAAHVVLTSQVARPESVTPLLVTAAFLALERSLGARDSRWLVPSGALLGLALQSHPSALALLPGVTFTLWRSGRGLVMSRWGAAGLATLALASVTVLLSITPPESAGSVVPAPAPDGSGAPLASGAYVDTFRDELLALGHLLAGRLVAHAAPDGRLEPLAWPYVALAVLGLAILSLRGRPLLPLAALSFLLIVPAPGAPDAGVPPGRPLMPMVVVGCVAAGVAVGTLAPLLARRGSAARLVTLALLALLALAPLENLRTYDVEREAAGGTEDDRRGTRPPVRERRLPRSLIVARREPPGPRGCSRGAPAIMGARVTRARRRR